MWGELGKGSEGWSERGPRRTWTFPPGAVGLLRERRGSLAQVVKGSLVAG